MEKTIIDLRKNIIYWINNKDISDLQQADTIIDFMFGTLNFRERAKIHKEWIKLRKEE